MQALYAMDAIYCTLWIINIACFGLSFFLPQVPVASDCQNPEDLAGNMQLWKGIYLSS